VELRLGDIIYKASSVERTKLQLLLQTFSRGRVIDAEDLGEVNNWVVANINAPAPVLALAAQNKAIALTIPTEPEWCVDMLYFDKRTETLHNLWGQENISEITKYCIESLKNITERFMVNFNTVFCNGALNSAPNIDSWEKFGYFRTMKKAKEQGYNVDGNLIKNKSMPKTKKYGSLLELRMMESGHRIFFVHRQGLNPEILIGGFYQKNQSISQNEAIQNAKKRIDDYKD
jgi:hypothetical protein